MKFCNRTNEIAELQRIKNLSFGRIFSNDCGYRQTQNWQNKFDNKSVENELSVYLFVGRKTEATLYKEYIQEISNSLNIFVFQKKISSFRSLFQYLMEIGTQRSFHLIIDEFQEFSISMSQFTAIYKTFGTHIAKRNQSYCKRFGLFVDE